MSGLESRAYTLEAFPELLRTRRGRIFAIAMHSGPG